MTRFVLGIDQERFDSLGDAHEAFALPFVPGHERLVPGDLMEFVCGDEHRTFAISKMTLPALHDAPPLTRFTLAPWKES